MAGYMLFLVFLLPVISGDPITYLSNWSSWGECSVTCGNGTESRTRACSAAGTGDPCTTDAVETRDCYIPPTPIDGEWGPWGEWSDCDNSPGYCEQTRCRECDNPAPQYEGEDCYGLACKTRHGHPPGPPGPPPGPPGPPGGGGFPGIPFILFPIPFWPSFSSWGPPPSPPHVDGNWGPWSHWGHCSVTEGDGHRTRQRSCNDPSPFGDGEDCCDDEGGSVDVEDCHVVPPPVDGGYGNWSEWSACASTCQGATKTRTRNCDNPEPRCGGANCDALGPSTETVFCNPDAPAPVNGYWQFSAWHCVEVSGCHAGTETRSPTACVPPQYCGNDCPAMPPAETRDAAACTVYPQWAEWGNDGPCNIGGNACGSGTQTRTRVCNNGACLELNCEDDNTDTEACIVDPVWGDWGAWGECSLGDQCGDGFRSRMRDCFNGTCPTLSCNGLNTETETCTNALTVGEWGEWSACSRTCKSKGGGKGSNKGFQIRTRTCNNTNCPGTSCPELDEVKECTNNTQCPAGGRGRCEYDGNQGQPHFFNFGRDLTRTGIPCEYYMLSVHVYPTSGVTAYDDIDVNMYVANWDTPILGNWFIYSVRIIITYSLNGATACQETFNTNGDALNALYNSSTEGPTLGWTKTSTCDSSSAVDYGYVFDNPTGNGDNTAYFYVRGLGDATDNEAVRIEFVAFDVAKAALRNNEKPGIYVSVREDSVYSDDPGDKFTNTHCSLVNETNTMVDYMKDASDVFQGGNSDRDLAGLWGLFEQDLPQDLPGVDSRCDATIDKYNNCPGGKENALFQCHHIVNGDQTVRCLFDNFGDPMGMFINCMNYYCDGNQTACNELVNADSVCNSVASASLTCAP